jgi:hypothetical protein
MKIKQILVIPIILAGLSAQSQQVSDALRFTQTSVGGTARIQAMGGAQGALGGDISSISGNPAGLGFYRKSDFAISPSLRFGTTESTFLNRTNSADRDNFSIPNIGFVITQMNQDYSGQEVRDGWVSYSFGLSYNRTNSFHEERFFGGFNPGSSMSQYFAANANIYGLSPSGTNSLEDMAYDNYIINYDNVNNVYTPVTTGNVTQKQRDRVRGSQNDWTIAFGSNYSNKLFLGASVGFGSVKYIRETQFEESGINDPANNLSSYKLDEELKVVGSSVNAKIGFIYRPVDLIRVGASMQTPNYYNMSEGYTTHLSSSFGNNDSSFTSDPLNYVFDYDLKTPFKFNFGTAIFFQQYGLISLDVDYLDYSSMKLSTSANDINFESDSKNEVKASYQSTFNYRIGAEAKLGDIALRAGYSIYGDPYQNQLIDRSRQSISAGLGYRSADYYFDFAFINTRAESLYAPYFLSNGSEPKVTSKQQLNTVMLTVGTRF